MKAESSTLILSTLFPLTTINRTIRRRFDSVRSPKSCYAVSKGAWLKIVNRLAPNFTAVDKYGNLSYKYDEKPY